MQEKERTVCNFNPRTREEKSRFYQMFDGANVVITKSGKMGEISTVCMGVGDARKVIRMDDDDDDGYSG